MESLLHQIEQSPWEVSKIAWDSSQKQYYAEAKNPHGEALRKHGPDEKTAVGHLLVAIMRHTQMRTSAQWKLGMWKTMFTDQLPAIAEAYAKAPVYDPKAATCFKELADDSTRRAAVIGQQLKVEIVDEPEPYKSSQEMADDIHRNKHFFVSRANCEHPVWTVDQNIAFRVVHDVLGHAVSGGDFGWQGENLACAAHFPLLSPTAQGALFTECIGQTAYAAHYRSFGPQKVALFPEFFEPPQQAENGPGHMGIHPSQMAVPTAMPQIDPSPQVGLPAGSVPPHMEGLGLTPVMNPQAGGFLGKVAASAFTDPNANWTSGTDPLDVSHNGVGNAYLDHGDPLEGQEVMDNAGKIDTGWSKLTRGDGSPDFDRMKQAIVNAFRVVLLSPRKDLRWNAIHYQDISHIPASTDDPKAYWDTLESRRRAWNQAQGIDPEAHMVYYKFVKPFESIIYQLHPELGFEGSKKLAQRTLFQWWTEEQQRIEADDAEKPAERQRSADEIERRANEALAKRLQLYIKDKYNPQTDVEDSNPEQIGLFDKTGAGQYNLLTGEEGLKYGAFMGTHLKSIAKIGQHANDLLDAALADVHDHDGAGHHFRSTVLQLGVPGVGPKVVSFAWLLLQPMTSQLATIDTHMMDVLGHNYDKDMNNRDYFGFERELAAGRDAAGYSHIPLGAFQWGMWDFKRTGPGSHQDHSAMRALDPIPHHTIDWVGKQQNLKGDSWLQQSPDWWRNTQSARDKAAQEWKDNVASSTPRDQVPYQILSSISKTGVMETAKGIKLHNGTEQWWSDGRPHVTYLHETGIHPNEVLDYGRRYDDGDQEWLKHIYGDYWDKAYDTPFWNFKSSLKDEGDEDEFHVGIQLPEELIKHIHTWVHAQDWPEGFEFDEPDDYHLTVLYTPTGYKNKELHEWIERHNVSGLRFENARIDQFPSQSGDKRAVVMRFDSPEGKQLANKLMDEAEERGLDITRFDGGYKPHITIGWTTENVKKQSRLGFDFRGGPLYISVPRPLRDEGDYFTEKLSSSGLAPWFEHQGQRYVGNPNQTIMEHAVNTLGMSTPDIWKALGESAGKDERPADGDQVGAEVGGGTTGESAPPGDHLRPTGSLLHTSKLTERF